MGLTLAQLTHAIKSKVDATMETHVAESIAEHALGFFGFSNRIIDNALEPTDRNMFYQLQDYDLLTTESEETTLWDGREWRITTGSSKQTLRTSPNWLFRMKTRKRRIPMLISMTVCLQVFGERVRVDDDYEEPLF